MACLLAAGCAAGPDFKRPAPPSVTAYTPAPLTAPVGTPGVAGGASQKFASGADIAGDWWTLFHSQPLDELIARSLANNHDLKAAQAALAAARETALSKRAAFFPTITAAFSATRQLQSGALAPTPSDNASEYSLFTPSVGIAYAPDVFGLNRRTLEGARAQQEAARYQMLATYITLASNVAAAVIQDASLRTQINATRQLIQINSGMVDILKDQLAKGYASRLDLAAQEAQLAQTQASLPPLLKQAAQQQDLVAVLAGRFPSEQPALDLDLSSLNLPQDLPLSLPSTLVAQRPDILQAEANMHAASAAIGVAAASRLPNIQLTADAGSTALAIGQVFGPGTGFWDMGAQAAATLFDGGALAHQERAARAAYEQAAEQYRSTVLGAFQNVADTLAALEQDAQGLKTAAAAADAAKVTLDLSQQQYKDGYASYLTLLSAEQSYQQARIALVQAEANRFADTAALYQALGGGWWNRPQLLKAENDH
jgi:NodT family efflux transporter outer membrane factor (OMF) lipoprotein